MLSASLRCSFTHDLASLRPGASYPAPLTSSLQSDLAISVSFRFRMRFRQFADQIAPTTVAPVLPMYTVGSCFSFPEHRHCHQARAARFGQSTTALGPRRLRAHPQAAPVPPRPTPPTVTAATATLRLRKRRQVMIYLNILWAWSFAFCAACLVLRAGCSFCNCRVLVFDRSGQSATNCKIPS